MWGPGAQGRRQAGRRSWVRDDNRCSCSLVRTQLGVLPCPFRQLPCPGTMSPRHAQGYLAGLGPLPASPPDPKLPEALGYAQFISGSSVSRQAIQPQHVWVRTSSRPRGLSTPLCFLSPSPTPLSQTTETYFSQFWRLENPKSGLALPGSQTATFPRCPRMGGERSLVSLPLLGRTSVSTGSELDPDDLLKGSVSNVVTRKFRASTYEFGGGHNVVHVIHLMVASPVV